MKPAETWSLFLFPASCAGQHESTRFIQRLQLHGPHSHGCAIIAPTLPQPKPSWVEAAPKNTALSWLQLFVWPWANHLTWLNQFAWLTHLSISRKWGKLCGPATGSTKVESIRVCEALGESWIGGITEIENILINYTNWLIIIKLEQFCSLERRKIYFPAISFAHILGKVTSNWRRLNEELNPNKINCQ